MDCTSCGKPRHVTWLLPGSGHVTTDTAVVVCGLLQLEKETAEGVGCWAERKTFGRESARVTECCKKLQIAKLHDLYCCSANIIKANKSRSM